jgi:hypothetical protein
MVRTQRIFQFHFRCPVLEATRGAPPVGVGTAFRHVDVSPDRVPAHTCRHQAVSLLWAILYTVAARGVPCMQR